MKKMIAMLLAAAMMLSMAACGGSGSNGSTTAATPTETQDNAAAIAAAAEKADANYGDGVLDINMAFSLESTTNFRNNTGRDQQIMHILYEQLGIFTADGTLAPWVAKEWHTEDGGFNYTVTIWDNVYDQAGNHITIDDIIWNIEESKTRALKPCFAKVVSVTKIDDYSMNVEMTSNIVGSFEAVMSDVFVVSKAAFEASGNEFADNVVSTSAYKMTEFVPSNSVSFEKVSNHWMAEDQMPEMVRPKVEKMRFQMISEASQIGIALETGKIDVALSMDTTAAVQYVNNPDFVSEQFSGNQGWQLFFSGHESRPVADNVALRQAICYAINTDEMVQGLCQGYGESMSDVCSPRHIGYNKAWESEPYYAQDLAKAKELVKQSGYNGEELSILCSSSTFVTRLAQMIQAYCGEAGINVKVDSRETAQMVAIRLDGSQYDMFINTIGGTYCADHWSIRYDPNAYATGDGTSRHDYTLGDLLYKTWTVDGYTQENIDAVHAYIRDNAIAYGMINPTVFNVWNAKLGLSNPVLYANGGIAVQACDYVSY